MSYDVVCDENGIYTVTFDGCDVKGGFVTEDDAWDWVDQQPEPE